VLCTQTRTGSNNCAFGGQALNINLEGSNNTAIGTEALAGNFGDNNIGIGAFAGQFIEGGSNNIEIGAMGKPATRGTSASGQKAFRTTFTSPDLWQGQSLKASRS